MKKGTWLSMVLLGAATLFAAPAAAQDIDLRGELELRAVQSDLDNDEGEDIDSSGIGVNAGAGASFKAGKATILAVDFDLGVFDFSDDARATLKSYGGAVALRQQITQELSIELRARRSENVAVLEALSADQNSLGAQLEWERGDHRVRLSAEWRERDYDTQIPAKGEGLRLDAQYNHRIGSYHWVRIDLRHEAMDSDEAPVRSFDRQVARVKYSLPLTSQIRLRPSVEWRQWSYDARIAQGDPQGNNRHDRYVAPSLELAWGRELRGLYGVASGEYRLRSSNDTRFDNDALRLGLRVGYRF